MGGILEEIKRLLAEKLIVREKTSPEIAKERYEVCLTCNFRDKKQDVCTQCGCFLDLKTNAAKNWNARRNRNEITHCPLGKWSDLEITNHYREIDGKPLITIKKQEDA